MVYGCQSREEKKIQAFMKLFEKMEKSEVVGKEVKRRKQSVEKALSAETATSSDYEDHKQVTDLALSSPVLDTLPLEEATVRTAVVGKEVKRRKQSVEKALSAETATSSDYEDQQQIVSGRAVDIEASELTTVETAEVKHDVESATIDVVDSKATVTSCTVTDMVINDSTTDEVQSSHGISESCLSPVDSPSKHTMERAVADTVAPEKVTDVTTDADKTGALVTDETESMTVEAVDDKASTVCLELSKLDAKNRYTKEKSFVTIDEPQHVTAKTLQDDVRTSTVFKLKKTDVAAETNSRLVTRSARPQPSAKLKFGVYSRKPLVSRTWVKTDEPDGIGDDAVADECTSEPETTTTRPKRRPVKLVLTFCHLVGLLYIVI